MRIQLWPWWAKPVLLLVVSMALLSPQVLATEVDDLQAYYVPLKDSAEPIDQYVNKLFTEAANRTKNCSRIEFQENMKSLLRPNSWMQRLFGGGVEEFANSSKAVERSLTDIDSSVYQNTPFSRSAFVSAGRVFRLAVLFPSVRINGITMGTDKLSHFFETGLMLYEKYLAPGTLSGQSREQRIEALVAEGILLEETNLGWLITGIKSYGDLHAHIQGAFFWEDLLSGANHLLGCEQNQFKFSGNFHLTDYANHSWSEAVECNEYVPPDQETYLDKFLRKDKNLTFADEVRINVKNLEATTGRRYECPIQPTDCTKSREFTLKHYPFLTANQLERITSPECRAVLKHQAIP